MGSAADFSGKIVILGNHLKINNKLIYRPIDHSVPHSVPEYIFNSCLEVCGFCDDKPCSNPLRSTRGV